MAELPSVARALLETIAGPESSGSYDVIYGGSRFSDFKDHPRQYVTITNGPNEGKKSSAAGKYQFLASTWDEQAQKLGLNDFSPASQDMAAWNLAKEEYRRDTGRDLQADLESGDLSRVAPSLRNQWTSMPGGIEQGITGSAFANAYTRALGAPPTQTPAVAAIGRVAPTPAAPIMRPGAPRQSRPGNFWGGLTGALAMANPGNIMRAAQVNAPAIKRGIAAPLLGTVAGRTAIMRALMPSNIGAAPRIASGSVAGGTPAIAVSSAGSRPVTLMRSGTGAGGTMSSAFDNANHGGQDMSVYRSNRDAIGGPITQSSIDRALSGGSTLVRRA